MARITWLGEPDGPSENTWNGYVFPVGQPVEIDNETMISKAKRNQFYKVEEQTKETRHVETKDQEGQSEKVQEKFQEANYPGKDEKDYPPIKKKARKPKAKGTGDPGGISARTTSDA